MRAWCDLVVLAVVLAGCRTQQPVAASPAEPSASTRTPAEVTLRALEQASDALADWRAGIEAGDRLDDGALLELRAASQRLGRELDALSLQVEAREAALRGSERTIAALVFPRAIAQPWIEALRGDDAGRREAALAQIDAALRGQELEAGAVSEPDDLTPRALARDVGQRRLAALLALQEARDASFEREPFRAPLLALAREATGPELVEALEALDATARRPGDEELVQQAWERAPGDLGDETLRLLVRFGDGRVTGRSEQVALELLRDVDGRRANLQLHGLWGAQVGPQLEARVLELARSTDPDVRHAAIYFGLSTFEPKSEAVVEALIGILAGPDPDDARRALWGLGRGVGPGLQGRVAAAVTDHGERQDDPDVRARCEELAARYAPR